MEGYLKSLATEWRHIFKRAVKPGGKIPLSELYETYGRKYNLEDGMEFLDWLRDVKLKGQIDKWEIVAGKEEEPKPKEKIESEMLVKRRYTVEDVVKLSARKGREIVPNIMDVKVLKYALKQARQLPKKDTLCNILERRIRELETIRRI